MDKGPDRTLMIAGGALLGLAALALFAGEKKRPLRKASKPSRGAASPTLRSAP